MTDKPAVAVLMSTYNGEQYISGQVESIFKQRDVTIHLYIRDDGSSDRTCDMLKRLEAGREDVCFDRSEKNLGPGMSFMKLLYDVVREGPEYAYYAFSDQDDIWLPDKLKIAVGALVKERRPALYCSNQILYEKWKTRPVKISRSSGSVPEGAYNQKYNFRMHDGYEPATGPGIDAGSLPGP